MDFDKLGFTMSESGEAGDLFPSLAMFISYHEPGDYLVEYVYPADLNDPEADDQSGVIIMHNTTKNTYQISLRMEDPFTEDMLKIQMERVKNKLKEATGAEVDMEFDQRFDDGYDRWIEVTVFHGELEEEWELEFLLPKLSRGIWQKD